MNQLAHIQKPIVEPPSQQKFSECVQNILFGSCLIAKYIKRVNLWTVQFALFRKLGKEIAVKLEYLFSETEFDEIYAYLTELNAS